MPRIVDYSQVLERMRGCGFKSLYHNSGAFGFTDSPGLRHIGWIGPPDATLRPAALKFARQVQPPYEANLVSLALRLWQESLPGPLWLMPMSHWAYELDVNEAWLGPALQSIQIDPALLKNRNTGDAIEFAQSESERFASLCQQLLERLTSSDYMLAFPNHPVLCTLHHHKQLWWSTTDQTLFDSILEKLV